MVGHIAQTGQIVATDFRAGNVSPNTDNLGFIKTCQDALSKDTNIRKLRIDAAGYQASIIDYCFENDIEFSIRAKMCQSLKDILVDKDNQGIKALERQIKCSLKPHSITVKISLLILMPVKSLPIKQMPSGLVETFA